MLTTAFKNLARIVARPVDERGLFQTARSAVRTFFATRHERLEGFDAQYGTDTGRHLTKLHRTAQANVEKFHSEAQRCHTFELPCMVLYPIQPFPVEVLDGGDFDWTLYRHP